MPQAIRQACAGRRVHSPNAKADEDARTPEELLDVIEAKGREVAEAIAELRRLSKSAH